MPAYTYLPSSPAGANLQRGCESVSPFGVPPLICGRPFKEAITAPSLLTGLGLDSSKRLLCSRQRPRGRGATSSASTKLPPLAPGVSPSWRGRAYYRHTTNHLSVLEHSTLWNWSTLQIHRNARNHNRVAEMMDSSHMTVHLRLLESPFNTCLVFR